MIKKVFYWHSDSPDAGHKDCICDYCDEPILEGEVPVRVWSKDNHETRFHSECALSVFQHEESFKWEYSK